MLAEFIKVIKWLIFYIILNRRKDKNENNKKTSPQSLSEEQKYHKKIQNQRKLPYKDSNEDYLKKKTAHNRTNSDSQKDTRISVTKDGEERYVVNY